MLAELETVLKSLTITLDPIHNQPTDLQIRNVDFSRLVIELEQRRAPQITLPGIPPIPDEILELEGREQALHQAISLLESDTHPALRPHQIARNDLEQRVAKFESDLQKLNPAELDDNIKSGLQSLFEKNPNCEVLEVVAAAPGVPHQVLFPFAQAMQHVVKSRLSVAEAHKQYQYARKTEIERLASEKASIQQKIAKLKGQDFSRLLGAFFTQFRDAESFPFAAWAEFEAEVLTRRRYVTNPSEWLIHAADVFAKRRSNLTLVAPISHRENASSKEPTATDFDVWDSQLAQQSNGDSTSTSSNKIHLMDIAYGQTYATLEVAILLLLHVFRIPINDATTSIPWLNYAIPVIGFVAITATAKMYRQPFWKPVRPMATGEKAVVILMALAPAIGFYGRQDWRDIYSFYFGVDSDFRIGFISFWGARWLLVSSWAASCAASKRRGK